MLQSLSYTYRTHTSHTHTRPLSQQASEDGSIDRSIQLTGKAKESIRINHELVMCSHKLFCLRERVAKTMSTSNNNNNDN